MRFKIVSGQSVVLDTQVVATPATTKATETSFLLIQWKPVPAEFTCRGIASTIVIMSLYSDCRQVFASGQWTERYRRPRGRSTHAQESPAWRSDHIRCMPCENFDASDTVAVEPLRIASQFGLCALTALTGRLILAVLVTLYIVVILARFSNSLIRISVKLVRWRTNSTVTCMQCCCYCTLYINVILFFWAQDYSSSSSSSSSSPDM